ncbi:MAG: hypothetical protein H0V51_03555 [Chloroflexi bacterium]|nr:hypothetical protein [Chloroflexota bacterium]
MLEVCAVCGDEVVEPAPIGIGSMLFHAGCLPRCRFCDRPYNLDEAGWDFRGGVAWSDQWGYVPRLHAAACPACTDDAERRDYGAGW